MDSHRIRIAIQGVPGRMGTRLVQLVAEAPDLALAAALGRDGNPSMGRDVGPSVGLGPLGVSMTSDLPVSGPVDVVVAFSTPRASLEVARTCAERKVPLVVGTTGLEVADREELRRLGEKIPLLVSPNTSRAVNLLMRLVAAAAGSIGKDADIEIVERHHRFKKDAPSGTALRLAEIASDAANKSQIIHGRSGLVGERPPGEIGVHALRTGDNPGEHTVVFGLMGECLELTHRALNRDGFARGALDAARLLIEKPAGLCAMTDLFP